jgi:NADH:ubiquinone oxidoreductase subunit H
METNRAPFDLLEGERELIRGFNIEIGSLLFVYLFLREYGIIILMSVVASLALLRNESLLGFVLSVLILLSRRCFPRLRYDVLIGLM